MGFSPALETLWQEENARTDWHASDRSCARLSSISSSPPWRQTRLNTETALQRRSHRPPQSDSLGFNGSLGHPGIRSYLDTILGKSFPRAVQREDGWCGLRQQTLYVCVCVCVCVCVRARAYVCVRMWVSGTASNSPHGFRQIASSVITKRAQELVSG